MKQLRMQARLVGCAGLLATTTAAPIGNPEAYRWPAYADYAGNERLLFPVKLEDARLRPEKTAIGLVVAGQAIAIDAEWLAREAPGSEWKHRVGGGELRVEARPDGGIRALLNGQRIPAHPMYWFAWFSFHPRTALVPAD